ncbi:MAG: hypothetical protein ACLFTR_05140 [Candidatus Woesearchaeota archaeon]
MGLDQDDTPVGSIIALILITITVFIIIVLTFDSCSEYAYSTEYQLCGDIEMEIIAPHSQENPCYDNEGNARFSYRNTGELPFEGINLKHEDVDVNISDYVPTLSRGDVVIDLDLQIGQIFRPINVSPIVYFEELDEEIVCERSMEKVRRLERCNEQG